MRSVAPILAVLLFAAAPAAAGDPPASNFGPSPVLPAPAKSLLPTNEIADADGWPAGKTPRPAPGLAVAAFADKLEHPRWLYVLPNGDVLVAESAGPAKTTDDDGVRGFIQKQVMKKAGSVVPSANRITLLRDADGDGRVDTRTVFAQGLFSPIGMVLVGSDFYVANADAVVRFAYTPGATSVSGPGTVLTRLPGGPRNHHWTKTLIASPDGTKLYVGVGSNSNAAENGLEEEKNRAAIWEIDRASGKARIYASGLRNPVGIAWQPQTGALWTVVNERDELGNDLVPDYMTSVRQGGFYGWPWSYYGNHVDTRVEPARPDMVAKALKPDYALGSHTASLGLAFDTRSALPAPYRGGAFIGQHGSWNRDPWVGYKVVFVRFENGRPTGLPIDVLTGFRVEDTAFGRPVGVAFDRTGALLVADDVGNMVWRVTPARAGATAAR